MKQSLRTLLSGILDYAGLFPPAKLALPDALRNYAAYLQGEAAWMLARFVCPCATLGAVDALRNRLAQPGEAPWRFSGLGRGGEDEASFLTGLHTDLAEVSGLHQRLEGGVLVDALETRLPASIVQAGARDVARVASAAAETWRDAGSPGDAAIPSLFLEITPGEDSTRAFAHAVEGARTARDRHRALGLKLRTGGVEAHQIPPVTQVAAFIAECASADVPFKATAGLHHPLRHESREVGARMHGFLNVFVAAALAHTERISARDLEPVLAEEDASAFSIRDDTIAWRGRRLTTERIRASRGALALSFGSCSLTEPVDDLRALGWW
ncbi:MAG: hypothetical protein FLDDKLPJ_01362 [Phycisphaerae bacterium]|nr:hypothetical protein [Phycisphaerae bacterium]